jgi:catechol 2,3-dioxygenase-like lactoylglutathione lyase family enzyme
MSVNALYPVLITSDLSRSRQFYAGLLELEAVFESYWFIQLVAPGDGGAQIGLVAAGHDSIPSRFRWEEGVAALVTIEVEDVDGVFARATSLDLPIELSLRDEEWGQRHFITRDPSGVAVDVVQVIPVTSPEFAAQYSPEAQPEIEIPGAN